MTAGEKKGRISMFGFKFGKKSFKREIVINAESLETRVAVLENGKLEEFQVEHPSEERIVGGIYKGVIKNLEDGLQAAFVDIGLKKNAFLHYWDMIPEDAARLEAAEDISIRNVAKRKKHTGAEIARMFPVGSEIVVQVTKGPISTKGPRVTANLSIPGRYLVMLPGSNLKGVSRKIEDEKERLRLKKVLARLPIPETIGLIVRTAGQGAKQRSFVRDLRSLMDVWEEISRGLTEKSAPCCLYQELDLVERVVRDWLTEDIDRIVVDDPAKYERIKDLASRISRRVRSRIQQYEGAAPIFEHFNLERQLESAFGRKIMLKSGGYLIFEETEALISVDVNTGRHKGAQTQEEVILEVNTEAAEEVARQLRLRNVGGLIVIDFIDMKQKKNRNKVYQALKDALQRDKAKTNVLAISHLGLLEMTRQRVDEGVLSSMHVDCPYCKGKGSVKSPLSMSVEIQRQIVALMRRFKGAGQGRKLQIIVSPTILERFRKEDEAILMDLESKFAGYLSFRADPARHVEDFEIRNAETGEVLHGYGAPAATRPA
jgi:ribonuclease G